MINHGTSNVDILPNAASMVGTSATLHLSSFDSQNGINQQQQTSLYITQVQPDIMASTLSAPTNFNFLPSQQSLSSFLNPIETATAHQLNNSSQSQQLAHIYPAIHPAQLQKIKERC